MLKTLLSALVSAFRSRQALILENIALRHQIAVEPILGLQRIAQKKGLPNCLRLNGSDLNRFSADYIIGTSDKLLDQPTDLNSTP